MSADRPAESDPTNAPMTTASTPGSASARVVVAPEWVEPSPELVELARAFGVAVEYWDQGGNYHRVGAATIAAVLALVTRRGPAWAVGLGNLRYLCR